MITVKSKLPFGLSFKTPDGKTHIIKGMNQGVLVKGQGLLGKYETTRMEESVWNFFAKTYSNSKYLKNKIIFAETKSSVANQKAKELQDDMTTKTGLEQADPNKVPKIKKSEKQQEGKGETV